MSRHSRFMAIVCAAALAWFIGKALNVPVWRDWDMGDRSDLALLAAGLVYFLTKPSMTQADKGRG